MKVLLQEKDMHENLFLAVVVVEVEGDKLNLEIGTQILADHMDCTPAEAVAYMNIKVEDEGAWMIVAGEEISFFLTNLDDSRLK